MDNIQKNDRYIAATLYALFLISRVSIYIDTSMIYAQYLTVELMLVGNFLIQTIQIAAIIIASIICAKRHKENLFVCLAARDVLNSFINQVIISLVIGLVLLIIYFGMIFIFWGKNTSIVSDVVFPAVNIAFYTLHFLNIAYAIDSIIAIIFTLSGKRFKNPLIIRLVR
jgi:uncharacterized Tic20 family protein